MMVCLLMFLLSFLLVNFCIFMFVSKDNGGFIWTYSRNVMVGATNFLNILTFGLPGQSFSGRCGINRKVYGGVWKFLADSLDYVFGLFGEKDHCENSINQDREGYSNLELGGFEVFKFIALMFAVFVVSQLMLAAEGVGLVVGYV